MEKKVLIILLLFSLNMHAEQYQDNFKHPRGCNYLCRLASAKVMTLQQSKYDISTEHNGDDTTVAYFAGSFSKGLEHDAITGLLTHNGQASYEQLLVAVDTGLQADFNAIVRAPGATRKFTNPQGAMARSLKGVPSQILPAPSAPTLSSAQHAADMIEDYLMAICRDVAFEDYGTGANTDVDTVHGGSLTNNAAAVLTALGSAYTGPKNFGVVTSDLLFRGLSLGDVAGPYISQFWWLSTFRHFLAVEQKQYVPVAQQRQFGVAWADFVALQNGTVPKPCDVYDFSGERYIITGRDAGTVVHVDAPGDYFLAEANILLYHKAPLSPVLPYYNGSMPNEDAFVTMATVDIYSAIMDVAQEALQHAWAHKWLANRRLRPEATAGLVHQAKITATNPFNLFHTLFDTLAGIDLLAWVKANNEKQATIPHNALPLAEAQTYLLPQLYAEGSPLHPSYLAGHATVAGACATVIKAFFKDTALLSSFVTPVKPDPTDPTVLIPLPENEDAAILTIGGETDKLASNIANSRNIAGVHYRADGDQSLLLGEELALKYLQDVGRKYAEHNFTGFELTKRDGTRVRVTPEGIEVV